MLGISQHVSESIIDKDLILLSLGNSGEPGDRRDRAS